MIDTRGYRSILCLNGDLPPPDFFKQWALPIIAADGAANRLINMNIIPQLIIGDLDSVHPDILVKHPFLHRPNQNQCDYQKSMQYLQEQDLLPCIVVGIQGGFLDHVLNNINIFMSSENLLYAPPIQGMVIQERGCKKFILPLDTKISLIGIPQAIVSSQGLKWELNQTPLSFPGFTSCFNRSIHSEVIIEVQNGALLVLIYEEACI